VFAAVLSTRQYRLTLASLRPAEIPPGYGSHPGPWLNVLVAGLGAVLIVYLALS
jgi:putative membrane protein